MDKKEALKDLVGHLVGSSSLVKTCQYPFGHPRDEDFHFCGEEVQVGSPYCDQHLKLCYRPVRN
jgi:hypothetical protein